MAKLKVVLSGTPINIKNISKDGGKMIQDFGIKISTQDFKTKEWINGFLNCRYIGDSYTLNSDNEYEFTGTLEPSKYTTSNGKEVDTIKMTAFDCKKLSSEKEKPKAEKKIAEISIDDFEFDNIDEEEIPF